ncbi:MAG: aminotransferase [Ilumatobacteraceae bacterium]
MRLARRSFDLIPSPIAAAHALLPQRRGSRRLLDLSQAAPAYPTAPVIADRIAAVAHEPDGGRYAPPPGLPHLREAFASELSASDGADVSPRHVLPTGGCNQAFCAVMSAITEPGDEVILPVPYYFNHDMWLRLSGVVPVHLHPTGSTAAGSEHLVPDVDRAASLITDRTRAIVLVSPGNPTGLTVPLDVIGAFADLAGERDLVLVLDETYRNFRTEDGPPHAEFRRPRWDEHVVSLHSFSKDLAIPGHRVGAIVGGEALLHEALKFIDCAQISAPRIGQEAVVAGLLHAAEWRRVQSDRVARLQRRFEAMMAGEPGGFRLVSAGAFFGWVRHPFETPSSEVVRRLVLDHDVLVIPGTAFTPADEGHLRFSFANLDDGDVEELGNRLDELT